MRRILAILVSCLLISSSAAAQVDPDPALDFVAWQKLADRAESVIDTAAASNSAMTILQSDLAAWSRKFRDRRISLQSEIDLLNSRLVALGEPIEGKPEDQRLALKRQEIQSRLAEVDVPYRIAGDAISHAEGLIIQIEDIRLTRTRESRATRGLIPLNPANWPTAIRLPVDSLRTSAERVGEAWASAAQRQQIIQTLPMALLWLVLGGLALTIMRHQAMRIADKIIPMEDGQVPRGGGFRAFVADAVLPVCGVWLIVAAATTSRLNHYLGQDIIFSIAIAASVVAASYWLARTLFAGDGSDLILSCLGTAWSRSAHRSVVWLGWVVAAQLVVDGWYPQATNHQAQIEVLSFPVLVAAAVWMYQLSHRLAENLAALAQIDDQRPYSDVVLAGITWLARAAAVIGTLFAVAGYGVAGDYLVFPLLYSLALMGVFVALESIVTGLISHVATRRGMVTGAAKLGLIRVLTAGTLLVAAVPPLALAWGATPADIAGAWQQAVAGISIGNQKITAADILRLLVVFAAGCVLTALSQSVLQRSVLPNTRLDPGAQRALITGVGYIGVILAGVAAVAMTNFDFTNVAIVAGALSIGIGFGLQTVVSNFVSGILLLLERPINVGDWIEVGDVSGTVRNISVRATLVETFDRARIVVPNTDLIGGRVTNWTLNNRQGRIILPVGVAYGTEPRLVERILLEIGNAHPEVLSDPAPMAVFMNFGADALEFELRVILTDVKFFLTARSDLNFAIAERFAQEGISIPFPQRDLWLRNPSDLIAPLPGNRKEIDPDAAAT